MKKNQKYTQEEMYLAIELWKESGISKQQYSRQNGISYTTFKYWVKKYNGEKKAVKPTISNSFLPVQVKTEPENTHLGHTNKEITINYPSGIKVQCPVDIDILQLQTMLTL